MGFPERHLSRQDIPFRDQVEADQFAILRGFLQTFHHFFGNISALFARIDDPRDASKIDYPLPCLFFTGVLLFICRLGARRQINSELRNNAPSVAKFEALFAVDNVPHGDTLEYTFQQVAIDPVQDVVCQMTNRLIRQKVIDPYRLLGRYVTIAIDGTGMLTFRHRHCRHCLTRTLTDGSTLYYHPVLEAKLVTPTGFAFSIMTEFIENPEPEPTKQDCELKAFYRLVKRLKARFPRLSICLLLDGLFACGPVFHICRDYRWQYLIVLKDDRLPSVNHEFEALWQLDPANKLTFCTGPNNVIRQEYRWVADIIYTDSDRRDHQLTVLECVETNPAKPNKNGQAVSTRFKWVTSLPITENNVIECANNGGRCRWKVENEGFNVQKNGGFELEHAYSENETSAKVFYLLMQIAHMLFQLMAKGSLFRRAFPKGVGSLKNIAARILEAWRNLRLTASQLHKLMTTSTRVSFFDSS